MREGIKEQTMDSMHGTLEPGPETAIDLRQERLGAVVRSGCQAEKLLTRTNVLPYRI